MNRKVQHKAGMAAVCPILVYAKCKETPQCKERRLEGHHMVLEYQSISDRKAGPSGMVSGLHDRYSGAINFQATWSPALGRAEKMKTTSHAEFPPQPLCPPYGPYTHTGDAIGAP